MSRKRKRVSSPRTRRTVRGPAAEQADPIWVDVAGRRMFVVGFTPGGAPYGVFEDELDDATGDLDMGVPDQMF